jgi:hypothetical protein
MSYNGRVNFGLTADYDAMPDLDLLADDLKASIAELGEAAASAEGGAVAATRSRKRLLKRQTEQKV